MWARHPDTHVNPRGASTPAGDRLAAGRERASTGVDGLDELIEGGFPANRTILVTGESGTGKTLFGVQFIAAGLAQGERCVCVSVDQRPEHLLQDSTFPSMALDAAVADGRLMMLDASPYFAATRQRSRHSTPIDARTIATDLSLQTRTIGARRVLIDSITSLVPPDLNRTEAHDYLRSLIHSLEDNLGCTVVMTARPPSAGDQQAICEGAEYLVSGILELTVRRLDSSFVRTLFLKKMRGTIAEPGEYPMRIEASTGLALLGRMPGGPKGVPQLPTQA